MSRRAARPARRDCSSPTSPACSPGRTRRCCSPTWAPRSSRSSRPTATRRARGRRPPVATLSPPTTWASTAGKRSLALDLRDARDLELAQRARPPRRRADPELPAGRPGQVRARPRHRQRGATPAVVYASISGFGPGAGAAVPGLRPHGAGDVRPDEPDRRPGRAALPGRHLGVRRDGRQPRGDRHPRGAAAPRRDRSRASTSRSTCCPRPSRAWSTTVRPTSPAASCPTAWATPTPASSRTSRCPPRTAT